MPQGIGGLWLAPGETRSIPLPAAQALRRSPDLAIAWADLDGAYAPSLTAGRLTGLAYMTPLSVFDGYGQVGVATVLELLRQGIAVDLYEGGWLHQRDLDPRLLALLKAPKQGFQIAVAKGPPPETIPTLVGRYRVNHAMWESDRLPDDWVPILNTLPLAIVPTTTQVQVYRDSGVTCPLAVVPDIIDVDFWSERSHTPAPDDLFTVVSWSRMTSRKMPIEMVLAFQEAFPLAQYPDLRFQLKTNGQNFGGGKGIIPAFADPRIQVLDGNWSLPELRDWAGRAHLAFFLSRGEGMFCPPLQAMALGLPVVCVDHSGPADFIDETVAYPVHLDPHAPLVPSPLGAGMRWWNPDQAHAVAQLQAAYTDYPEAQRRAAAARDRVCDRYAPATVIAQLRAVLERLIP